MSLLRAMTNALFPMALGVACLGSLFIYRMFPSWESRDRWLIASLLPAIVVWIGDFLRLTLEAPFDFWESLRLLPAYLLANGVPMYFPPHSGPVLDMMYGPMTALAYLPITFVTQRPDIAAMSAKFLTVSYYFLPALWLVLRVKDRDLRNRVLGLCLFVGFAFYSLESDVLRGSAYGNHSDAPALGLSALACIFLLYRNKERIWGSYILSALAAVLAVWTKQVTLPILIALPVYLWFTDGPKSALRYAAILFGFGMCTLALFGALFNMKNMFFNLVVHPSSEPWENHLMKVQGRAVVELVEECRWMLMILIFYMAYEMRPSAPPRAPGRYWFNGHDYGLFTWVGLFMIPTSIIGRLKIAGALNALSYSVYFFALAVGLLFIDVVSTPESFSYDRVAKGLVKVGTLFMLVSAVLIRAPTLIYYYVHFSQTLDVVRNNPLKQGYTYVKAHPNEVYLPRNPLVTYLAEGKLYHFDFAIGERAFAGFPISEDHFRSSMPTHVRWVMYAPNELDNYVLRFMPEFYKRVEMPTFADWRIYTRPS